MSFDIPDSPVPPLHEYRAWGVRTCGFKPATTDGDCGRPAIWHLLFGDDAGLACDEHMKLTTSRWAIYDVHEVVEDCNAEGAWWVFSWVHPPGRCQMDEPAPALEEARQLQLAGQR